MTMYVIEKSKNILRMRTHIQPKDVPYANSFYNDEEMLCVMPSECQSSSVVRITM